MDDKRIVGLAANAEYARWAYRETNPEDIFKKPEALDDMLVIDVSSGSYAGTLCLIASVRARGGSDPG